MDALPKTALIVPCFNEESRFSAASFQRALTDYSSLQFVFVDDGSVDKTMHLLDRIARNQPRVHVVHLDRNRGKAEAVRQGMLHVFHHGTADVVGYWDADLSTPLPEWVPMVRLLEETGAEIVIGARVKLLGRQISRRPARHYIGRVFATAASHTLRVPVYDTQCGAKLFRNGKVAKAVFAKPFACRWVFDVEVLARAIDQLASGNGDMDRIVEYPLGQWTDVDGSRLQWRDFLFAGTDLMKIALRNGRFRFKNAWSMLRPRNL